jgi:hypothetical protein
MAKKTNALPTPQYNAAIPVMAASYIGKLGDDRGCEP